VSLVAEVNEAFLDEPPTWVSAFVADPVDSLSALFAGRWYHGRLNAEDPEELLLDWADGLDGVEGFGELLDTSLAEWFARHWQAAITADSPELTWHRALRVAALRQTSLPRAIAELRKHRLDAPEVLGPMTRSVSRDPMGWYWTCLAQHQADDELRDRWWALSELTPGTPWFHGRVGLLGLRGLPGPDLGGFRESAAHGLLRLATALDLRVTARMLKQGTAQRAARTAATELARAYPFPRDWATFWSANADQLEARPRRWLAAVLGEPKHVARRRRPAVTPLRFDSSWPRRAREIAAQLRAGEEQARSDADALLAEQRAYAAATGDRYGLVRTLCNFAWATIGGDPASAGVWAEEARSRDAWSPYAWAMSARASLAQGRPTRALTLLVEAVERFPDDVVARTGLGEVLKVRGELAACEAVYREAVERFPDALVARTGLGEVLKARGDLAAAEAVYREALLRFPDAVVARTGLGEVLKVRGDLAAAEAVYREAVEQFPGDAVARTGLGQVVKARDELLAAERVFHEAVERFARDVVDRPGLDDVWKARDRLVDAEKVERETVERFVDMVVARNGLGEVLKARGGPAVAEELEREAVERFPREVLAYTGPGDAVEAHGAMVAAEEVYREAVLRFPDNDVARSGLAAVIQVRARSPQASRDAATARVRRWRSSDAMRSTGGLHIAPSNRARERDGDSLSGDASSSRSTGEIGPSESRTASESVAERVSRTRVSLRLAGLSEDAERSRLLAEAQAALEPIVHDVPHHRDALFTKLELLIELRVLDEARDALRGLPEYLSRRPEFLALEGRIELEAIRAGTAARYEPEVLDTVLRPWADAGRLHSALALNVPIVRLRASSQVYDGSALQEVREESLREVRALVARVEDVPEAGSDPQRNASLRSWWRREMSAVFGELDGGGEEDAASYADAEALMGRSQGLLDSLERELIDAARYSSSPV